MKARRLVAEAEVKIQRCVGFGPGGQFGRQAGTGRGHAGRGSDAHPAGVETNGKGAWRKTVEQLDEPGDAVARGSQQSRRKLDLQQQAFAIAGNELAHAAQHLELGTLGVDLHDMHRLIGEAVVERDDFDRYGRARGVDGGIGDNDLTANGRIVDPYAAAVAAVVPPVPAGGGWWSGLAAAISALLGAIGLQRLRRRRDD